MILLQTLPDEGGMPLGGCAKADEVLGGLRQLERRLQEGGALLVEGEVAVGVVVMQSRGSYTKRCVGVVTGYSPGCRSGYRVFAGFRVAGLFILDPNLTVTRYRKSGRENRV